MTGRIWLIAGPTASGKSALALRLALETGGEIVNADSMQLYADLPILSAQPSRQEQAQAPHHLFGDVDAADGWSVGRWVRAALPILEGITARGRAAIVAGGTGLYFNALTQGLAEIPPVPVEVRRQAQADFDAMGESSFRDRLHTHDPAAADRIAWADRQRLVRAWEVFAATDTPLSDWHQSGQPVLPAGSWRAVALEPPREALYARCDARFEAMIAAGALDEVRALVARDLDPTLPALKAVGVRELSAHLRGEMSLAGAVDAARRETRRYAKRQGTWMRGRMADWPRVTEIDAEAQWRQFVALTPP